MVTLETLREILGPLAIIGVIVTERLTVPDNPRLFTTIVVVAEEPAFMARDSGLLSTLKSPVGEETTCTATVAVWVIVPLVAVMVTV
jgi:hypothetical protein